MSILDLQRTIAEAGRIRIGQQVPTSNGRTRPEKLETFRLTSPDRQRIEEAAVLFGGVVTPWQAPAGAQWQVVTTSAELQVIVPPQAMAFSQHLELWSAGGCQRRCDGVTEVLSQQPCLCDPEQRECDYHTRLSVMIRDLPGLALWRLDTQGWYAARELAGAVEILALAAGRGLMIPARLLLEQRSVKRPGKDGKPQTLRFAVPRLDLGITPGELLLAGSPPAGVPLAVLTDGAPPERRLTPVPQIEGPRPTIAEQSAPPPSSPPRRNAAPEIPPSGRRRNAAIRVPSDTSDAKSPGDAGYWRARAFAEGAERGIDADRMRGLAAKHLNLPAEGFSMASLDEAAWEGIHRMILGFPTVAPPEEAPPPQEIPGAAPTTPAESLAKTPEQAAADVAVKRAARAEAAVTTGLSASALAAIAMQAGRTKGQLAVAIGAITGTIPAPTGVTAVVRAMSDEERGELATELKLEWRTS